MAADKSYGPANYRKQGGRTQVIGGNLNVAAGVPGEVLPTTGTLSAQTTSATLTGSDYAGTIVVVTTATGTAANVDLFTVTFGTAYPNAPIVFLTNMTPGAGSATTFSGSFGANTVAAGSFKVQPLAAVTASSTITIGYQVIGVE